MKLRLAVLFVTLILPISLYRVHARPPVIASLTQAGVLVCTNLSPGSIATVAWAATPEGPWLTDLKGLNGVTVGTNGSISVNVPLSSNGTVFYRVLGVPPFDPDQGMALIPGGSFTMGDNLGDGMPYAPTNIYVSSFYMDTNLVTYSLWQSVYSYATSNGYSFDDPGSVKNDATNQPIQTISWYDAVKWCNARSQSAGLTPVYYTDAGLTEIDTNGDTNTVVYPNFTANGYQLPTEAQWEKAARGGSIGLRFPWGNTISESQANYYGDTENPINSFDGISFDLGPDGYNTNFDNGSEPYTSPVGSFPANGYGLFDMAGNLQEWCWDWAGGGYGLPTTNNPTGPSSGTFRITRGGYWGFQAFTARCGYRSESNPPRAESYTGFRCVKNP